MTDYKERADRNLYVSRTGMPVTVEVLRKYHGPTNVVAV